MPVGSRVEDCDWLVAKGMVASVTRSVRWDVPSNQTVSSHWISSGVYMVVTINNQPKPGYKSDLNLKQKLGLSIFHTNS